MQPMLWRQMQLIIISRPYSYFEMSKAASYPSSRKKWIGHILLCYQDLADFRHYESCLKKKKKTNILGAERCYQPLLNASFYIENGSWKNWFNICQIYFTKYINIPWTVHCILMHIKYYMSYCFVWLFVSVCMFFVLLYFDFSFDLLYCDRIRIAALLVNFLGHGWFVFFLLVICRTNYIYHFAPS